MVSTEVARALEGLVPGSHAVVVYDTKENKEDVLLSHLTLGREHDGLVYVCSEESPLEARRRMERIGLDVEDRSRSGTLLVKNYDEVYIVGGKVDPPAIIKGFSDLARDYSQRGYGMRAAAEMSCFFDHRKVSDLLAYERDLHRQLSFPAVGLCGYNLMKMYNSGDLETLWPILRAHSLVIMTGPNGSFALEPDKVQREDVERTMGLIEGSFPTPAQWSRERRHS